MCNKCLEEEIEDLKAKVKREAEWASTTISELRATLSNTKAELSDVRRDLEDTTTTLDNYRDIHVKSSRINSTLRKSVSDQEDAIRTLTEERDVSREMHQSLSTAYNDLLVLYVKNCDEYDSLVSRYDDLLARYEKSCDDYEKLASRFIWRNDAD